MDIDDQFDFVCSQLDVCCQMVGINLGQSRDALGALAACSADLKKLGDFCKDDETLQEAYRLFKKFNSASGHKVTYSLGTAWNILENREPLRRAWEDEFAPSYERVFCDFALHTGAAFVYCNEYVRTNKRNALGGKARAKIEAAKGKKVIEYMLDMDDYASMKGDQIASEILGKPGVYTSHRTIADTIREHRKMQGAVHNAQDA